MYRRRKRAKKHKDPNVPHELTRAGALCVALVNTAFPKRDDRRRDKRAPPSRPLASYAELVTWSQRMGSVGPVAGEQLLAAAAREPEKATAVLALVIELRDAFGRIFNALAQKQDLRAEDLAILNDILRARGREVIPAPNGFRRAWGGDAETLERVLWPLAESAAELLASDKHQKVRQCSTKGCLRLFVYGNSRRQWCDANTCGSRAKGRRHHKRRRENMRRRTPRQQIMAEWERDKKELEELKAELAEREEKERERRVAPRDGRGDE